MISSRRYSQQPGHDLLSSLMRPRPDYMPRLDGNELEDECIFLIIAGHETTAAFLTWTLFLLARHPQVEHKVVDELNSVVGSGELAAQHLGRCRYLEQVLKEALRLYPPGWLLMRSTRTDTRLGGLHLRRGTTILLSPYITHRRPEVFSEPHRFDPDRFGPGRPPLPRGAFIPFGAGWASCIGQQFAMIEAKAFLISMLRRYRIELSCLAAQPSGLAILVPDRPLHGRLRPRNG
jgi:cytochrome P450